MTITTSKGKTFEAEAVYCPTYDGACMIQLADSRRLIEVAQDFDGCETLAVHDEGRDREYDGYTGLNMIQRTVTGKVQLLLVREAENGTV